MSNILVIGAGSWGTALSIHLSKIGNNVFLHSWKESHNKQMRAANSNELYLPGIIFPNTLNVVFNYKESFQRYTDIIIAVPSSAFLYVVQQISEVFSKSVGIISAVKGFYSDKLDLCHQISSKVLPKNNYVAISGPSFASEVAKALPTSITVSSLNLVYAKYVKSIFNSDQFRCHISNDILGVEICGATKNVFSIAIGILDGLKMGSNIRSEFFVRSFIEMQILAKFLGSRSKTIEGLSGLGDLVLTCNDNKSRNRRFGILLGEGKTTTEASKIIQKVVEGINSTKVISLFAKKHSLNMQVVHMTFNIVYNNCSVMNALNDVLSNGKIF